MKKRAFFLFVCLAMLVAGCSRQQSPLHQEPVLSPSNTSEVDGIILRGEFTACICCGGWVLQVDSTEYLIPQFPDNMDFNIADEQLPLPVTIQFEPDTTMPVCWELTHRIIVSSIHKQ